MGHVCDFTGLSGHVCYLSVKVTSVTSVNSVPVASVACPCHVRYVSSEVCWVTPITSLVCRVKSDVCYLSVRVTSVVYPSDVCYLCVRVTSVVYPSDVCYLSVRVTSVVYPSDVCYLSVPVASVVYPSGVCYLSVPVASVVCAGDACYLVGLPGRVYCLAKRSSCWVKSVISASLPPQWSIQATSVTSILLSVGIAC